MRESMSTSLLNQTRIEREKPSLNVGDGDSSPQARQRVRPEARRRRRSTLIKLACSDPSEGQAREMLHLLADTGGCNKLTEFATPGVANICPNVQPSV